MSHVLSDKVEVSSMESYFFDDVLNFSDASYLLKTMNSDSQKRIISSVFRGGSLVYSRHENYNGHLNEDELFDKVRGYHENSKNHITALFDFSKKYRSSKDLGKRTLLVRAFMKNKMYKEAINEIAAIMQIDPKLSVLYLYLGQVRMQLSDYREAANCFIKAIEQDQDFADYHFHLGKSYLELKECRQAINEFIQAIKLNSYYGDAYYFLGLAYLVNAVVKENFDLAKEASSYAQKCFSKAVQLNPNFMNEDFERGAKALAAGDIAAAHKLFTSGLEQLAKDSQHHFILEFYMQYLSSEGGLEMSEIQAYIDKLQGLLRKYAGYADLNHELGIAYLILGNCINSMAQKSFRAALAINPAYAEAQRMLDLLGSNRNLV